MATLDSTSHQQIPIELFSLIFFILNFGNFVKSFNLSSFILSAYATFFMNQVTILIVRVLCYGVFTLKGNHCINKVTGVHMLDREFIQLYTFT